ncbi:MAG: DUF456 domain-containing protein [Actinomycetota bacterium]
MSDLEATIVIGLVMVVGVLGTVVPFLPGVMLIWLAAVVYGFLVGFSPIGIAVLVVLTLLVAASVIKSVVVPRRAAEGHDVSRWSQLVAVLGAVVGFFVIPIVGVVIGALIGLFVAEYVHHREAGEAWGSTVAVAKGFGLSALIEIGIAVFMTAVWAAWALSVLG